MGKVIQNFDSDKAHGHDISIRMIICAKSIIMTLQIVYKLCLKKDYFPDNWKKANVPVHKKMPSIYYGLSICGKVQERLHYNSVFEFFIQNILITSNQSGFKTRDSCINQLISITHGICKLFYDGYEYFLIYRKHLRNGGPALHRRWSFPFRISSVNVRKSSRTADFTTYTEEILNGKLDFLCNARFSLQTKIKPHTG